MTTSDQMRQRIEGFEGFRKDAYLDGAGVATLAYGHTNGVQMGDTCTEAQGDVWLSEDLATAEACIDRLVTVPLTQNQFDALVSFTYNLGCSRLQNSTLLKLLNAGEPNASVAAQFLVWNRVAGKVSNGLDERRAAERKIYLYGFAPVPEAQ